MQPYLRPNYPDLAVALNGWNLLKLFRTLVFMVRTGSLVQWSLITYHCIDASLAWLQLSICNGHLWPPSIGLSALGFLWTDHFTFIAFIDILGTFSSFLNLNWNCLDSARIDKSLKIQYIEEILRASSITKYHNSLVFSHPVPCFSGLGALAPPATPAFNDPNNL